MKNSVESFWKNSIRVIKTDKSKKKIEPEDKIILLGSCFSQNIVSRLSERWIDASSSPFGILYNPLSISNALKVLNGDIQVQEDDFFERDGLWRNILFDKSPALKDKKSSIKNHLRLVESCKKDLNDSILILSFGSSNYWYHSASNCIAGNCHKLPGDQFIRRSASLNDMIDNLIPILSEMSNNGNFKQIITTVSPVRYKNETGEENSLSKSKLRLLCEELSRKLNCYYFPSFEILIDELRDYRWYSNDLVHPSEASIEYIFRRFIESVGSERLIEWITDSEKLFNGLRHKSMQSGSEADILFKNSLKKEKERLIMKWQIQRLSNVIV